MLRKPAFSEASYAWLIRYQVLDDSFYRIAQDFARDDGQVPGRFREKPAT